MKIYSAEQMREIDAEAIDKYGIDGIILMENAAIAVKDEIIRSDLYRRRYALVVCGRGNNGGDGFAVARQLIGHFECVKAAFFEDESRLKGDCAKNYNIIKNLGIEVIDNLDELEAFARDCDVIADALYGFGFRGELSESDAQIADVVNKSGAYVVAVDIPSGVSADTGECGFAVKADKTVTFTGLKQAQVTFPAAGFCGDVCVRGIGIPDAVTQNRGVGETIEKELVRCILPKRARNAHKGSCGRIFVTGGSRGMSGAVCMSTAAALKSGAGLVTAGIPEGINDVFEQKVTEAMSVALEENADGILSDSCAQTIADFAEKSDVLIIGPGMGRSESVVHILKKCLLKCTKKIIIDADALYALALDVDMLKKTAAQVIITPHHAEMGRLIGRNAEWVEKNAILCAKEFAEKYNVTVVLKGAYTVVAGNGRVYINNGAGNAGMATGGSGDVLCGVIGALACIMENEKAALCGVYIHALAGDAAKERFGMISMTAGDIINALPDAFKKIML